MSLRAPPEHGGAGKCIRVYETKYTLISEKVMRIAIKGAHMAGPLPNDQRTTCDKEVPARGGTPTWRVARCPLGQPHLNDRRCLT
jgi:hypothetical protein